jgi:hypothetical protein
MGFSAKVVLDSISPAGHRLTTMEVTIARFNLVDFNTHRMFSRNSASSRAIPIEKQLGRVTNDPMIPLFWAKNQKGMLATEELVDEARDAVERIWRRTAVAITDVARSLLDIGLHKQLTNRILEPFMWQTILVTATNWDNFFALRRHPETQAELRHAADLMWEAREASTPILTLEDHWHLPLVYGPTGTLLYTEDMDDAVALARELGTTSLKILRKVSVGRCARVSSLTQDGRRDLRADIDLCDKRMRKNGHMSPFEHVARPMNNWEYQNIFKQDKLHWEEETESWKRIGTTHYLGNIEGWVQERKLIANEDNFAKISA